MGQKQQEINDHDFKNPQNYKLKSKKILPYKSSWGPPLEQP